MASGPSASDVVERLLHWSAGDGRVRKFAAQCGLYQLPFGDVARGNSRNEGSMQLRIDCSEDPDVVAYGSPRRAASCHMHIFTTRERETREARGDTPVSYAA